MGCSPNQKSVPLICWVPRAGKCFPSRIVALLSGRGLLGRSSRFGPFCAREAPICASPQRLVKPENHKMLRFSFRSDAKYCRSRENRTASLYLRLTGVFPQGKHTDGIAAAAVASSARELSRGSADAAEFSEPARSPSWPPCRQACRRRRSSCSSALLRPAGESHEPCRIGLGRRGRARRS